MSTVLPESLADGRFKLLEVIGEGGMATVYRAYDQRLQRPRAIKVLSPALANRPSLRRRFLAEAQTMATLEESRVVRVFDMGEDGERVYIVMELVEGGSLLDRLRRGGPLPGRMAAQVALQLCESLQAAHDAGVIHRDIKPHNILLTRTGEIRITDFGIAQVQTEGNDGLTKTGAVMGTWGFMAPEQKSNAKTVDARADIYSVGATLWALLRNDTPPELFMADEEATMVEGIPEPLTEVVKRATRYRREDRYPTVRAMADSVRALVDLLPDDPPDTPPLALPRVEEPRQRMDTLAQFQSEPPAPAAGTMVPDALGPDPEVAGPPSPGRPGETLLVDEAPAPRSRTRGPLLGAALGGLVLLGLLGWMALGGGAGGEAGGDAVDPLVATVDPAVPVPTPPDAASLLPPAPVVEALPLPGTSPPVPAGPAPHPPATDPPAPSTGSGPPAADPPPELVAGGPAVTPPVEPAAAPEVPAEPAVAEVAPPPAPEPAPTPVEPTRPVALEHSAPGAATAGDTVTFTASGPGSSWAVTLYYRVPGTSTFNQRSMRQSGGAWTLSLKTDPTTTALAYFIKAESGSTTLYAGKPTAPLTLTLAAPATDASPTPQ